MRSLFVTALLMAEPHELKQATAQIMVRSLEPTGWTVPPGWYGLVTGAGVGIIRQDGMEREEGLRLLELLGEPDPESRSQEFDGRRLVRIGGGYIVLNYFKYRDHDHTAAERQKRLRDRRKVTRDSVTVTRNGDGEASQSPLQSHIAEDRGQNDRVQSSEVLSSSAREELLRIVASRPDMSLFAWQSELKVSLEGMPGHAALTEQQLEEACRDYLGNGGSGPNGPNLKHFRAYLQRAAKSATSTTAQKPGIGEQAYQTAKAALEGL